MTRLLSRASAGVMFVSAISATVDVPEARAAGYYLGDISPRGLGRAGAFVAGANDGMAYYYNGGALSRLKGTTFTANVASVEQYIWFDRTDTSTETFEPVENIGPPMPVPAFVVTQSIGEKTTVALGWYSPYGPDYEYDPDGAQRYTLKDSLLLQGSGGPTVAYEALPGVAVSAGLTWTFQKIEEDIALGSAFLVDGAPVGEIHDIDIHISAADYRAWSWNLGLLIEPSARWALGASVASARTYDATGELEVAFAEGNPLAEFIEEEAVTDDDVTVLISMPLIARLGFAYRPLSALEVELAMVYEAWSILEETTVTGLDITLTSTTGEIYITDDVDLPAGFQDAVSVRLGSEYDPTDSLTLRAGGLWESSAVPTKSLGVNVVDSRKWGAGAGLTYTFAEGFDLDVGVMKLFMREQTVRDSDLEMALLGIDLLALDEAGLVDGENVGNGKYRSNATLAAIGLHIALGQGPDNTDREVE